MTEDNFTLKIFYNFWKEYQDHIKTAIAPLTAEQLALRPAPHLRSVGEIALHIIACRAYWFTDFIGEGDEQMRVYAGWNKIALTLGAPLPSTAELAQGLDYTWQFMAACLARWTPDDMRQTFPDDWGDGKVVDVPRAWVVWHVLEHDLHHGGELSHTLGLHNLPAEFPG